MKSSFDTDLLTDFIVLRVREKLLEKCIPMAEAILGEVVDEVLKEAEVQVKMHMDRNVSTMSYDVIIKRIGLGRQ